MKRPWFLLGSAGLLAAAGCASQQQPYAYYPQGYAPPAVASPTYAQPYYAQPTTAPVVQGGTPVMQGGAPMVQAMPMSQPVMYAAPQQVCPQCVQCQQ